MEAFRRLGVADHTIASVCHWHPEYHTATRTSIDGDACKAALLGGDVAIVAAAIAAGVALPRDALELAVQSGSLAMVELTARVLSVELGASPFVLEALVRADFVAALEPLLAAGLDVNEVDWRGQPPLHLAAWKNSAAMVHALVGAGARVNATDARERSALHVCAREGHVEALRALLANGAVPSSSVEDLEQEDTGAPTILLSSSSAQPVRRRMGQAESAVAVAARSGHAEVVRTLLDHGGVAETVRSWTLLRAIRKREQ